MKVGRSSVTAPGALGGGVRPISSWMAAPAGPSCDIRSATASPTTVPAASASAFGVDRSSVPCACPLMRTPSAASRKLGRRPASSVRPTRSASTPGSPLSNRAPACPNCANAEKPGSARALPVARFEREQVGLDEHSHGSRADPDTHHWCDDRSTAGAGDDAHAERHLRRPEPEADLVSGGRAADELRQMREPPRPAGRARHDLIEPAGKRRGASLRKQPERQRRDVIVQQPEQSDHRSQGPALGLASKGIGLRTDQAKDEFQGGVVQIVEIVGRDREIARCGRAWQLQSTQVEGKRRGRAACRRDANRQPEPTEGWVDAERDVGGQADGGRGRLANQGTDSRPRGPPWRRGRWARRPWSPRRDPTCAAARRCRCPWHPPPSGRGRRRS